MGGAVGESRRGVIQANAIEILRAAFIEGVSTRSAAMRVGCCYDTARFWRRDMEKAGVIPALRYRRVADGKIQDVTRMGSYARERWAGSAPPKRNSKRRLKAIAADRREALSLVTLGTAAVPQIRPAPAPGGDSANRPRSS
jgi:hypothetical protein